MARPRPTGDTACAFIGALLFGIGFLAFVLSDWFLAAERLTRTLVLNQAMASVALVAWTVTFPLPLVRFRVLFGGGMLAADGLLVALLPPTSVFSTSMTTLAGLAVTTSAIGTLFLGDLFATKEVATNEKPMTGDAVKWGRAIALISLVLGGLAVVHGLLFAPFYGGGGPPPPPGSGRPWPPPDYRGFQLWIGAASSLIGMIGMAIVGGVRFLRHRALFGVGILAAAGFLIISLVLAGAGLMDGARYQIGAVEAGLGFLLLAFGAGLIVELTICKPSVPHAGAGEIKTTPSATTETSARSIPRPAP